MLQLFRVPNLLIVALTQYLLQYLVLLPVLQMAGVTPLLDHFHFFLLVTTTVIIAAAGYVINDMMDQEMDLINKPEKLVVGKIISRKKASLLYWSFNITGAIIAGYLADFAGNKKLFFIYPAAVLLLYFYSKKFKQKPLLGNVVVSAFCAGVAGIVLFSERSSYQQLFNVQPILANKITLLFTGYIVFAFFSTLLREIIKDIEDMEGDKRLGLQTFPIIYGLRPTKIMAGGIAVFMILFLCIGSYWLFVTEEKMAAFFALSGICLPLILIVNYLFKAEIKEQFSRLSQLVKMVMLAGLVLLIIIWKF